MKTMEKLLWEEAMQLKKMSDEAKRRLKEAPKGHLRIKSKRGRMECYYKKEGESGNGRYMRKEEWELAQKIAQRDYDVEFVKKAERRSGAISDFLAKWQETNIDNIYAGMSQLRRKIIQAPLLPDEEYIRRWQAAKYDGKGFAEDSQEIITERGERVRSKSEKIIADKLYTLGIPYRYEYPLTLEGNIKMYPDFTILKMPAREEVYLEHLGMMDDMNYVDSVMYKLSTYERNGIYLGVNLFVTYETGKKVLNTRAVDGLLRKLFVEE